MAGPPPQAGSPGGALMICSTSRATAMAVEMTGDGESASSTGAGDPADSSRLTAPRPTPQRGSLQRCLRPPTKPASSGCSLRSQYGGPGATYPEILQVLEDLATADPTVAWHAGNSVAVAVAPPPSSPRPEAACMLLEGHRTLRILRNHRWYPDAGRRRVPAGRTLAVPHRRGRRLLGRASWRSSRHLAEPTPPKSACAWCQADTWVVERTWNERSRDARYGQPRRDRARRVRPELLAYDTDTSTPCSTRRSIGMTHSVVRPTRCGGRRASESPDGSWFKRMTATLADPCRRARRDRPARQGTNAARR